MAEPAAPPECPADPIATTRYSPTAGGIQGSHPVAVKVSVEAPCTSRFASVGAWEVAAAALAVPSTLTASESDPARVAARARTRRRRRRPGPSREPASKYRLVDIAITLLVVVAPLRGVDGVGSTGRPALAASSGLPSAAVEV
jgi:hypothetical protein